MRPEWPVASQFNGRNFPPSTTLLDDRAAREVWDWLSRRYSDRRLTPDLSLESDLGVDSMEWLHLALEIERRVGIAWSDEAMARIGTVRDLLHEVSEARGTGKTAPRASFLDEPEAHLGAEQRQWLEPLRPSGIRFSRALHGLNRLIMIRLFRLRVEGADRLPDGQVTYTPTHGSFLDAFVMVAALDHLRLMRAFWAADANLAFGNPLSRRVSRLAQAFPFDAEHGFLSGMTSAAAVLERGHDLIWFPEGRRSRTTKLQDFKPGIGILLERFPVPVIPVAIVGAHEAYPPGRILPWPHPVTVAFHAPLDPAELDRQGEGDKAEDRITHALQRHTAEFYHRTRSAARDRWLV